MRWNKILIVFLNSRFLIKKKENVCSNLSIILYVKISISLFEMSIKILKKYNFIIGWKDSLVIWGRGCGQIRPWWNCKNLSTQSNRSTSRSRHSKSCRRKPIFTGAHFYRTSLQLGQRWLSWLRKYRHNLSHSNFNNRFITV